MQESTQDKFMHAESLKMPFDAHASAAAAAEKDARRDPFTREEEEEEEQVESEH